MISIFLIFSDAQISKNYSSMPIGKVNEEIDRLFKEVFLINRIVVMFPKGFNTLVYYNV